MEFEEEAFMNLRIRSAGNTPPAEDLGSDPACSILDVLGVDLCARAILDYVPVRELVRTERVCRRWQGVVLSYLHTCPLTFISFKSFKHYRDSYDRAIVIHDINRSIPIVCKTLDKWGPYVKKVILGMDEYSDIIASKCPNVQNLEIIIDDDEEHSPPSIKEINNFKHLKHVALDSCGRFIDSSHIDLVLSGLLQDGNFESIEISITANDDLTGSFLQYLNEKKLKSLELYGCQSLSVPCLLSAVHNLQNVTCLNLDNQITLFNNVHILLKDMIQLEELSLSCYKSGVAMSKELIKSISGLVNLKRLIMASNRSLVNDSLLEALAQTCKKLKYLDIRDKAAIITARGIAALCRRQPAPIIRLQFCFGDVDDDELESHFLAFKIRSTNQELERQGYLELTWDWFKSACRTRTSLQLKLEAATADNQKRQKLELIMT